MKRALTPFVMLSLVVLGADFTNNGATLTIDAGVTITADGSFENASGTVINSGTLEVSGDLLNSGSFNSQAVSTIKLNGGNQSFFSGTYTNLIIDGTDVKTMLGDITVNGVLTLNSGTVDLNGNTLTVNGDIIYNGGSVSGDGNLVNVQGCDTPEPSTGTGSISYPGEADVIEPGSAITILWNFSGPGQCHLFLYNNNQYLLDIYRFAINDGEFSWTIPNNQGSSNCYQIVVGYYWTGDSPGDLPNNDYDYIVSDYFTIEEVDVTPPAAPQNFSAISGDGQVTLIWDAGSESDIVSYNIYRDTSSPASTLLTSVYGAGATIYYDSDVTNDQTYYYRMTAVDGNGNESELSYETESTPNSATSVQILEWSGWDNYCSQECNDPCSDQMIWDDVSDDEMKTYVAPEDNWSCSNIIVLQKTVFFPSPVLLKQEVQLTGSLGGIIKFKVDGANQYTHNGSVSGYSPYEYQVNIAQGTHTLRFEASHNTNEYAGFCTVRRGRAYDASTPPAPTNLTVLNYDNSVLLGWSTVPDESVLGYNIYRGTASPARS